MRSEGPQRLLATLGVTEGESRASRLMLVGAQDLTSGQPPSFSGRTASAPEFVEMYL